MLNINGQPLLPQQPYPPTNSVDQEARILSLGLIIDQRARQDPHVGVEHSSAEWFTIVAVHVGDIAKAMIRGDGAEYQASIIGLTATMFAWVENECKRSATRNSNSVTPIQDTPEAS